MIQGVPATFHLCSTLVSSTRWWFYKHVEYKLCSRFQKAWRARSMSLRGQNVKLWKWSSRSSGDLGSWENQKCEMFSEKSCRQWTNPHQEREVMNAAASSAIGWGCPGPWELTSCHSLSWDLNRASGFNVCPDGFLSCLIPLLSVYLVLFFWKGNVYSAALYVRSIQFAFLFL